MADDRFKLREDIQHFPNSLKELSPKIAKLLWREVSRLELDPYAGTQLRHTSSALYEIRISRRFRLIYEVHERRRIVVLRQVISRKLLKQVLSARSY